MPDSDKMVLCSRQAAQNVKKSPYGDRETLTFLYTSKVGIWLVRDTRFVLKIYFK